MGGGTFCAFWGGSRGFIGASREFNRFFTGSFSIFVSGEEAMRLRVEGSKIREAEESPLNVNFSIQ